MHVCFTNCKEFIPDCPNTDSTISMNDGSNFIHHFQPFYYDLDVQMNTQISKETYNTVCIERKYETIGRDFITKLQRNGKLYLNFLNFDKHLNIVKAVNIFSWCLQFYDNYQLNRANVLIDTSVPHLSDIIKFHNRRKTSLSFSERFCIQWQNRVRLDTNTKNVYALFKGRILKTLGRLLKTSYFGTSIYDIVDRWADTITHYKKECILKRLASTKSRLVDYDNNRMIIDKTYPFGSNSTFVYERDKNSKELKELLHFRNTWFYFMSVDSTNRAYCRCPQYRIFFNEKMNQLKSKNQDISELIKEKNNFEIRMIEGCKPECERRKIMIKKQEIINQKDLEKYYNSLN